MTDLEHKAADIAAALTAIVLERAVSPYSESSAGSVFLTLYGHVSYALNPPAAPEPAPAPTPAVNPKKSVTPDAIFSLEDGKSYKTLRRHLTGLGLTPEQYREKWGLAADYPMTAPNYSTRRAELARAAGLGRKKGASQ